MTPRAIWSALVFTSLSLLCISSPIHAQGFVEHLEPPALERGKTTRVLVFGSGLGEPLDLWTSLSRGAIKATPVGEQSATRVVLDIAVAADAPVGICGARLATADGLSNAFLFLIDDLPVRPAPAAEAAPAKVALPAALWGRFREGAMDRFAIEVAAGQRVSFEAVGNRLGKDVDPLVTIRDAKGRFVAERDNDAGLYFDCRFEHTFTDAGTFTVEMRDARFHGAEHGFYVLRMGRFPAERVALPASIQWGKRFALHLPGIEPIIPDRAPTDQENRYSFTYPGEAAGEFFSVVKRKGDDGSAWLPMEAISTAVIVHHSPGDTFDDATPAKVGASLCGILQKPGERHFFKVSLAKGQRIQVRAEARAFNSPADLEVGITDPKGKELRRAGENAQEEIVLDFTAGEAGAYGLTVRDVNHDGGPAFAYRVEVRSPRPEVQVSADVEGLTVPRGTYQPVPLTITRSDHTGPISLALVGAPPGVTLTPNEIGEGINTVVCQLAASSDTPLGLHTLQIMATPIAPPVTKDGKKGTSPVATLVHTRPLIDRQIINVDLIPHALREDQRRLPPALADRFALQVTPPAPFAIELPDKLVTLPRYQKADFAIVTTRLPGFDGPIAFSAKGGQIADKEEGRTRVYAEFSEAKGDRLKVMGSIHSKILTNLAKHRVDVTAVGADKDRRVSLTRTFDLDIRTAFVVAAEPATLQLEPGASAKVRLTADRMKTFDGDVTVQLSPSQGLNLPEMVVIPKGQTGVEMTIEVDADRMPGRHNINLTATAVVNGLEEEQRGTLVVEIEKKAAPKK